MGICLSEKKKKLEIFKTYISVKLLNQNEAKIIEKLKIY